MNASPGVWLLAWRRFERDRLGLACLVVVLIYGAVMAAAAAGWIVRDWPEEVAVTYAPPTFLGPEAPRAAPAAAAETAPQGAREDYGIADPLADDLAEIARELAGVSATETRAATL
ncbi:MAG TPA: ABC transporter permease, partial [Burkholderiales bacterium]|nr:ABC transporter permease [Burkholderiales bacterium]